ncbi:hypothetical protein OO18_29625, partial [Raoultella ornithinolytica]
MCIRDIRNQNVSSIAVFAPNQYGIGMIGTPRARFSEQPGIGSDLIQRIYKFMVQFWVFHNI